jgi:hypothetical protein
MNNSRPAAVCVLHLVQRIRTSRKYDGGAGFF